MTSVRRGWLFLSIRFGRLALPTNVVMWGVTRVASFPYRSYRRIVVVVARARRYSGTNFCARLAQTRRVMGPGESLGGAAEWSTERGHQACKRFRDAVDGGFKLLSRMVRESIMDDVLSGVAGSEEAYCRAYKMVDGEWKMTATGRDRLLFMFDNLWRQSEMGVDCGRGGLPRPIWAESLEVSRGSEEALSALLLIAQTD